MKTYGANKSTEFTSKQISVLYYKAKNRELKVEKWFINKLYNAAEYCGYDDNKCMEQFERSVLSILDAMFAGETEKCQKIIDEVEENEYNLMGSKTKKSINRDMIVA